MLNHTSKIRACLITSTVECFDQAFKYLQWGLQSHVLAKLEILTPQTIRAGIYKRHKRQWEKNRLTSKASKKKKKKTTKKSPAATDHGGFLHFILKYVLLAIIFCPTS